MSHRDLDALKERMRNAQATTTAKPKVKYRKKAKLTPKAKSELCLRLVEADVAVKEALLNRDAITWQVYKDGLPATLIAKSLGIADGTLYPRLDKLRDTLGIKKKKTK